jgi:DNA/RNA endonuclease G (NUC1)
VLLSRRESRGFRVLAPDCLEPGEQGIARGPINSAAQSDTVPSNGRIQSLGYQGRDQFFRANTDEATSGLFECFVRIIHGAQDARREEPRRPSESFRPDSRVAVPLASCFYTVTGLTRAGYQRGHLAASSTIGDYFGAEAQDETFLLTNVVPEQAWHNEHIWAALERREADHYPREFGFTENWDGPIFSQPQAASYNGLSVPVPTGMYKIIERPDGQLLAFIIPENQGEIDTRSLPQELSTVAEIERETGLNFWFVTPERKTERAVHLW